MESCGFDTVAPVSIAWKLQTVTELLRDTPIIVQVEKSPQPVVTPKFPAVESASPTLSRPVPRPERTSKAVVGEYGYELVYMPPGDFLMGSNEANGGTWGSWKLFLQLGGRSTIASLGDEAPFNCSVEGTDRENHTEAQT